MKVLLFIILLMTLLVYYFHTTKAMDPDELRKGDDEYFSQFGALMESIKVLSTGAVPGVRLPGEGEKEPEVSKDPDHNIFVPEPPKRVQTRPSKGPGKLYTWVDVHGTVHYTNSIDDIPPRYRNQSRPADLPEVNIINKQDSEDDYLPLNRSRRSYNNAHDRNSFERQQSEQNRRMIQQRVRQKQREQRKRSRVRKVEDLGFTN